MKAVVVHYQVKLEFAEQNAANINRVMAALRETGSAGVRYQSLQDAEDPSKFTHIGFSMTSLGA